MLHCWTNALELSIKSFYARKSIVCFCVTLTYVVTLRRGRAHTQNTMGCFLINTLQWVAISSVSILPRGNLRRGPGMWAPWYMPGSLDLVSHATSSHTQPFSASFLRRPGCRLTALSLPGFQFILSMCPRPTWLCFLLTWRRSHPWVVAELLYLLPQRQQGGQAPPVKHLLEGVVENISSISESA